MPLTIIYMRIIPRAGSATESLGEWLASAVQTAKTPEAQVKACQRRADAQRLGCDYVLASHAEYDAYKVASKAHLETHRSEELS